MYRRNKIPFLDWTTLRASYNTKYNWLAASLLARTNHMGNTLIQYTNQDHQWGIEI